MVNVGNDGDVADVGTWGKRHAMAVIVAVGIATKIRNACTGRFAGHLHGTLRGTFAWDVARDASRVGAAPCCRPQRRAAKPP